MAILEAKLSRPSAGIPPYKKLYIPSFDVAVNAGYKIYGGEQFGVENIWRLTKGVIWIHTSAVVANRQILFNNSLDMGGISYATCGIASDDIAASKYGVTEIGDIRYIDSGVHWQSSVDVLNFIGGNIIFNGLDYITILCNNPQAGDTMFFALEFEYLNRAMGVRETL